MLIKKTKDYVHLLVPIFRTNLYVSSPKSSLKWVFETKIDPDSITAPAKDEIGSCEKVEHKSGAMALSIVLPKQYDESTLWHECIHAARAILDYVGVDDSDEDDEMIPYLTEWLVKMVKEHWYGKKVDYAK